MTPHGLTREVKALGADTLAVLMNVKLKEDWARLVSETKSKFGDIAFFHNNAGGGGSDFGMKIE